MTTENTHEDLGTIALGETKQVTGTVANGLLGGVEHDPMDSFEIALGEGVEGLRVSISTSQPVTGDLFAQLSALPLSSLTGASAIIAMDSGFFDGSRSAYVQANLDAGNPIVYDTGGPVETTFTAIHNSVILGIEGEKMVAAGFMPQADVMPYTMSITGVGNSGTPATPTPEPQPGGTGNDSVDAADLGAYYDAGAGLDIVTFSGASNDYTVTRTAEGLNVQGPNGEQMLLGVERLHYSDRNIAFDADGTAGQAYRLYEGLLGREPDAGGLGYWLDRLDAGETVLDIVQAFFAAGEFAPVANADNRGFLTYLYERTFDRAADDGGLSYWQDVLANGMTRAEVAAQFVESAELKGMVEAAMADGVWYA